MSAILTTLTEIGTGVTGFFVALFNGIAALFYTPGVAEAPGQITLFAYLVLIAVVFGLGKWAINMILRLFKFGN